MVAFKLPLNRRVRTGQTWSTQRRSSVAVGREFR